MSIYDKASLVLIPSGTKTSKVYSQKPVNGDGDFTFSRSTAATRVNADGNIEKETQNLLLQSNSFDVSANWLSSNVSETGGQAGYDGTNNAWLVDIIGGASNQRTDQSITANGVITFSVYAKAGSLNWISLRSDAPAVTQVFYDLSTGSIGSSFGDVIDSSMEDVGGGWYRCSMTISSTLIVRIYLATANGNTNQSSGNLYIQDAQVEQGLVARDYIETTTAAVEGGITDNVPRLDYTDSSCPALLLEPQRTNLLANSEYLNDWFKTAVSVNSNVATSPEGLQNASEFVVTTQQTAEGIATGFTADGTSDYVVSGYISKNSTTALVALKIRDYLGAGTTHCFVQFSPATGVVQASIGEYAIESFNDDWWYVWSKPTTTIPSGARNAIIRIDNQSVGTNCIAYGIQVEAGSYATSYIPTYGTSVTRGKDDCTIADTGDIIADSKGSFFIDLDVDFLDNNGLIPITAGSGTADLYYLWLTTGGTIRSEWYNGGGLQAAIATSGGYFNIGDRLKIAAGYQDNDFVMYVNGTLIGTDTSGNAPSPTLLRIGKYNVDNYTGGAINEFIAFPSRLSNEELAALTTI